MAAGLRASIALNKLEEARLRALLETSPSREIRIWAETDLEIVVKRTEKLKAELGEIERE